MVTELCGIVIRKEKKIREEDLIQTEASSHNAYELSAVGQLLPEDGCTKSEPA